jgi:hypothetical protein
VTRVSPIAKASPWWVSQAHEHHPAIKEEKKIKDTEIKRKKL